MSDHCKVRSLWLQLCPALSVPIVHGLCFLGHVVSSIVLLHSVFLWFYLFIFIFGDYPCKFFESNICFSSYKFSFCLFAGISLDLWNLNLWDLYKPPFILKPFLWLHIFKHKPFPSYFALIFTTGSWALSSGVLWSVPPANLWPLVSPGLINDSKLIPCAQLHYGNSSNSSCLLNAFRAKKKK